MRSLISILILLCLPMLTGRADEAFERKLDFAQNFTVAEYPTHTLLTVRNAYRNSQTEYVYALVARDQPLPDNLPKAATVVRTPVEKVVLMETVYVGYLDALDQLDSIVGAATADYISHPEVVARIESGAIKRIQFGQKLNIERLLLLQPDLILTTSLGGGQMDIAPQLQRAGLHMVLTADYMERHPLARTEWLKFLAPFFEREAQSEAVFDRIKKDYLKLRKKTEEVTTRPSVFAGAPYSGAWHVPGGDSFIARAIRDAGARYLWADDRSQGGIPLDTERVFLKAADADFWIHPSAYRSLSELFDADARFTKFRAAQIGQVYNNSRQISTRGGNNIWERGIVHPEEVLADLIHIFHPELTPEHELIYYEALR